MNVALRFVTLVALLVVHGVTPSAATAGETCAPIPAGQLFLPFDFVIPGTAPRPIYVFMPTVGVLTFPAQESPLVSLEVLPPRMTLAEDVFVAGEDVRGCLDPATGGGELDFQRPAPYLVRAEYANGQVDGYVVFVVTKPSAEPSRVQAGPAPDISGFVDVPVVQTVPNPDPSLPPIPDPNLTQVGYRGSEFASDPGNFREVSSISDLGDQILRDQVPGRDMHISLRFHGSAGTLLIGGQTIGLGEAGRQNFAAFIGALGGVKRITFLSCETGLGEEGCNFMRRVAQSTGAEVRAMTGSVTTTWKLNNPSGTNRYVQNGQMRTATAAGCQ